MTTRNNFLEHHGPGAPHPGPSGDSRELINSWAGGNVGGTKSFQIRPTVIGRSDFTFHSRLMRGHPPAGEGGARSWLASCLPQNEGEQGDTPPLCREPRGGVGEWRWGHTAHKSFSPDFLLKTLDKKPLRAGIESPPSWQESATSFTPHSTWLHHLPLCLWKCSWVLPRGEAECSSCKAICCPESLKASPYLTFWLSPSYVSSCIIKRMTSPSFPPG